jgi:hypothetical protein
MRHKLAPPPAWTKCLIIIVMASGSPERFSNRVARHGHACRHTRSQRISPISVNTPFPSFSSHWQIGREPTSRYIPRERHGTLERENSIYITRTNRPGQTKASAKPSNVCLLHGRYGCLTSTIPTPLLATMVHRSSLPS